jgi:hypothetical protein
VAPLPPGASAHSGKYSSGLYKAGMSETDERTAAPAELPRTPETAALILATFADLYRQEVGAEEDVHRTLPFFGTALGIVIGALAYAAGRLPKWPDLATHRALAAFLVAAGLLGLAIFEAGCVLMWISLAIARQNYQRIGPEPKLLARLAELQAYYDRQSVDGPERDADLLADVRQMLVESYCAATPANRKLNEQRYKYRARASMHLVRSLIWALGATSAIFMADKLGYLPRITP